MRTTTVTPGDSQSESKEHCLRSHGHADLPKTYGEIIGRIVDNASLDDGKLTHDIIDATAEIYSALCAAGNKPTYDGPMIRDPDVVIGMDLAQFVLKVTGLNDIKDLKSQTTRSTQWPPNLMLHMQNVLLCFPDRQGHVRRLPFQEKNGTDQMTVAELLGSIFERVITIDDFDETLDVQSSHIDKMKGLLATMKERKAQYVDDASNAVRNRIVLFPNRCDWGTLARQITQEADLTKVLPTPVTTSHVKNLTNISRNWAPAETIADLLTLLFKKEATIEMLDSNKQTKLSKGAVDNMKKVKNKMVQLKKFYPEAPHEATVKLALDLLEATPHQIYVAITFKAKVTQEILEAQITVGHIARLENICKNSFCPSARRRSNAHFGHILSGLFGFEVTPKNWPEIKNDKVKLEHLDEMFSFRSRFSSRNNSLLLLVQDSTKLAPNMDFLIASETYASLASQLAQQTDISVEDLDGPITVSHFRNYETMEKLYWSQHKELEQLKEKESTTAESGTKRTLDIIDEGKARRLGRIASKRPRKILVPPHNSTAFPSCDIIQAKLREYLKEHSPDEQVDFVTHNLTWFEWALKLITDVWIPVAKITIWRDLLRTTKYVGSNGGWNAIYCLRVDQGHFASLVCWLGGRGVDEAFLRGHSIATQANNDTDEKASRTEALVQFIIKECNCVSSRLCKTDINNKSPTSWVTDKKLQARKGEIWSNSFMYHNTAHLTKDSASRKIMTQQTMFDIMCYLDRIYPGLRDLMNKRNSSVSQDDWDSELFTDESKCIAECCEI